MALRTIGEISKSMNEPVHRLRYAIASRGIAPTLVAGGYKLYDDGAVEQIRGAISTIEQRTTTRRAQVPA